MLRKYVEALSIRLLHSDVFGPFFGIHISPGQALGAGQPVFYIEVPNLHCAVRTGAGQRRAVGISRETPHGVGVTIERLEEFTCSRITEVYYPVAAGGGQYLAVTSPCHAENRSKVTGDGS